jgi:hypothetical protein
MAQLRDFPNYDSRSNDDLARLLYQNSGPAKAAQGASQTRLVVMQQPAPEPMASRRVSELPPQHWPLDERKPEFGPLSDREERALFAALSKGTKANLGREPTVQELMLLVEQVNHARAIVSSAEQVMRGNDGIYVEGGRIVFRDSAQRRRGLHEGVEAA